LTTHLVSCPLCSLWPHRPYQPSPALRPPPETITQAKAFNQYRWQDTSNVIQPVAEHMPSHPTSRKTQGIQYQLFGQSHDSTSLVRPITAQQNTRLANHITAHTSAVVLPSLVGSRGRAFLVLCVVPASLDQQEDYRSALSGQQDDHRSAVSDQQGD
jgi:hypothetical protein